MSRKTIKNKYLQRKTRRAGGAIIKLKCEYNTNNNSEKENGITRLSMANFVGPRASNKAAYKKAKVNAWLKNEAKKRAVKEKKMAMAAAATRSAPTRTLSDAVKRRLAEEKAARMELEAKAARFETNNGMLHPWAHKGKKYYRLFTGEIWEAAPNNTAANWVGLYNKATNTINTSAPEPEYNVS